MYILPCFILIMLFSFIPSFMSIYYSFTKFRGVEAPLFIGLDNYKRLFKDPFVKAAIWNTVRYTFIVVPFHTALPLILAAVLTSFFRNKIGGFIKSVLFVPVISSMVLCGVVWSYMLSAESYGVVNSVLGIIGIGPVNWLGRTQTSLIGICIVAIWKSVGYYLVIYYAAIMDIPRSLYEAAEVDGANSVHQLLYITLPSLRPIILMVVTLGIIWSFQAFDLVYTMTAGGPGMSTVTLVYTVYTSAFREFNMGYACSIAVFLLILIMFVTGLQRFAFKRWG